MQITDVLDWFKGLRETPRPVTVQVHGQPFAVNEDGTLGIPVHPVLPIAPVATPTLALATLTGLVAAVIADVDNYTKAARFAVKVDDYATVSLVSLEADQWGRRHVWAQAKSTEANAFPFEQYQDAEPFILRMHAGFVPDANTEALIRMASSLTSGSSVHVADDGFSQEVTINEGGVKTGAVKIPPRIILKPYRTFREVTPVVSTFLLRFRGAKDAMPTVALLPVDGGGWKVDTVWAVRDWLVGKLPEGTVVIA